MIAMKIEFKWYRARMLWNTNALGYCCKYFDGANYRLWASRGQGLYSSQLLGQCLACSWRSINACWMNSTVGTELRAQTQWFSLPACREGRGRLIRRLQLGAEFKPSTSCNPQVWRINQWGKSFTLILQLSSSSIFSSFKSRWTTPFWNEKTGRELNGSSWDERKWERGRKEESEQREIFDRLKKCVSAGGLRPHPSGPLSLSWSSLPATSTAPATGEH